MLLQKRLITQNIRTVLLLNLKATDTTPPIVPTFNTDIAGKAGTQTPITVTIDPNTTVELFDKDGNSLGSGETDGTGQVTIIPTKPIPEGNVTAKATDHAEHPNSSTSRSSSYD